MENREIDELENAPATGNESPRQAGMSHADIVRKVEAVLAAPGVSWI